MIDAAKNKVRAPIFPLNARTLALTSMGLGFCRPAPGTWGSMPPAALVALMGLLGAPAGWIDIALGLVLIVSCAVCIALGEYAEERFGRKDAGEVVIDETAGQSLALLFGIGHAAGTGAGTVASYFMHILLPCAAGFFLFRFFDIVKPWPARRLESLPAGWGVLADDLMAGLYALAVMQAGWWLVGSA